MSLGGRGIPLNARKSAKSSNGPVLPASHLEDSQPNETINKRWHRAPPVVLSTAPRAKRGGPWRGRGEARGWRGRGRGRGHGDPFRDAKPSVGAETADRGRAQVSSGEWSIRWKPPLKPDTYNPSRSPHIYESNLHAGISAVNPTNSAGTSSTRGNTVAEVSAPRFSSPNGMPSSSSVQISHQSSANSFQHSDGQTTEGRGHRKLYFTPRKISRISPKRMKLAHRNGEDDCISAFSVDSDETSLSIPVEASTAKSNTYIPTPSASHTANITTNIVTHEAVHEPAHEPASDVQIKHEEDDVQVLESKPSPKTSGSLWYHPLPPECVKGRPNFDIERRKWSKRESQILQNKGLKIVRTLFRSDGMSLDWTSKIPVWPDTLLPAIPANSGNGNSHPPSTSVTKGKDELDNHSQMMSSSEIIDLTLDDDNPGPSTHTLPGPSSSMKHSSPSRKKHSARKRIRSPSSPAAPQPSVSYSPDHIIQLRPSRSSQVHALSPKPSPIHLPTPAREVPLETKRIPTSEVILVDSDDDEADTPLAQVIKERVVERGKQKESILSNSMQTTKPTVFSNRNLSPRASFSHQPGNLIVNAPTSSHSPVQVLDVLDSRISQHHSDDRLAHTHSQPSALPSRVMSKIAPHSDDPTSISIPGLNFSETESLIPPMRFLSSAPSNDNSNEDGDGYDNRMDEQVDELEDDVGLEIGQSTAPVSNSTMGTSSTMKIFAGNSNQRTGRGTGTSPQSVERKSQGPGSVGSTDDADAAEAEEIIVGCIESSDEENMGVEMDVDVDVGLGVDPGINDRDESVENAAGPEPGVQMRVSVTPSESERSRMEDLALQFLRQYVQLFDGDRSQLQHAYAEGAIFSCTVIHPSTSPSSESDPAAREFCPSFPSLPSFSLLLPSSRFPPRIIGPAEITKSLLSLNSSYKFFPRNSNADLDYDLLYLGSASEDGSGSGGVLLGVHGQVVKPHPGLYAQNLDSGVAFDWSIILRPVPAPFGCELQGDGDGSWPLKVVSHQMVVRSAPASGRPTDVFSWLD